MKKIFEKYYTRTSLANNSKYIKGDVLDLGCGRGKYKDLVLSSADKYTGCDYYKYDNVDVMSSAENTPFQDGQFDTIICLQVLEHVLRPHKVVNEIARILKPGGYLLLSAPWLHPYHGEPDDYFRFSKDALVYLLEDSGLKIIKTETTGGKWRVIETFTRRWCKLKILYKILSKIFILLDSLSNSKKSLDTPDHFIVATK